MTYSLHDIAGRMRAERGMSAAQSIVAISGGGGYYFPQTRVGAFLPAIADATGDLSHIRCDGSLCVFRQDLQDLQDSRKNQP